jgi:hypothetical protein
MVTFPCLLLNRRIPAGSRTVIEQKEKKHK